MPFTRRSAYACLVLLGTACSGARSEEFFDEPDGGGQIGNGDAGAPDDGGDPAFDAGFGDPDGSTNAPDGSVLPGEGVTVTVLAAGQPAPLVRVVLHGADGAVREVRETDDAGRVFAAEAPAMVTILAPVGNTTLMEGGPFTYLGVRDGDDLRIELEEPAYVAPNTNLNVLLPGAFPGALYYFVNAGAQDCFDTVQPSDLATPVLMPLEQACLGESMAVLGAAVGSGGTTIAFTSLTGVAAPAPDSTDAVTLPAWQVPESVTLDLVNLQEGSQAYPSIDPLRNGKIFFLGTPPAFVTGSPFAQPMPPNLFDRLGLRISVSTSGPDSDSYKSLETQVDYGPALSVDLNDLLAAPVPGELAVEDPAHPVLALPEGFPVGTDMGVLTFQFEVAAGDFSSTLWWTFVLPGDTTLVRVPDMPADVMDLSQSTTTSLIDHTAYDVASIEDYEDLKAHTLKFIGGGEGSNLSVELPEPSTLRRSNVRAR